jgi:hypothetical protein
VKRLLRNAVALIGFAVACGLVLAAATVLAVVIAR